MSSMHTHATHISGGAITWECAPNGRYIFTLTLIRECIGAPLSNTTQQIQNNAGAQISVFPISVTYINPECIVKPCRADSLGAGFLGAYQIAKYQSAPIFLAGVPPPQGWSFHWSMCCRPNSANLVNEANLYIESKMYGYPGMAANPCAHSTVQWNDYSMLIACTGQQQALPPPLVNFSGDSVYYALTYSRISASSSAPYLSGFTSQLPFGASTTNSDSLSFFETTAMMQFKTNVVGRHYVAITAKTFCKGFLLSDVVIDIPIYTKACVPPVGICGSTQPSSPTQASLGWLPNFDTLTNVTPAPFSLHNNYRHYAIHAKLGDTIKFDINSTDLDLNPNCSAEIITIKAYGEHMSKGPLYSSDSNCAGGYPCATLTSLNANNQFSAALSNNVQFKIPITCELITCSKQKIFYFDISTNNCPIATHTYLTIEVLLDTPEPTQPQFDTIHSVVMPARKIFLSWNQYADTNFTFQSYELYHKLNNGLFALLHTTTNVQDTTFLHENVALGMHHYRIIARNNCSDAGSLLFWAKEISFLSSIGLPEWVSEIKIYPQPMSDFIRISSANAIKNVELRLYDINGSLLIFETINQLTEHEINTARLPKGVYVLQIGNSEYTYTQKIIK
jgi:hypothetical protein